ncbi:HPP family protein [Streptomyces noursei]|uniref:Membrane protein n=1 Tax=Streptomyces noursei TaxID=1971 RepID=A0A059WG21_STRNR|nr:HPP family protein [Streptomyces noursei]AKA08046.1 HPP family protein+B94 [Streptomyces noursei ZPM]AIA08373.1 HPP family protein [Streptomyces noursei]EXU89374.1 HPP family protein+B94 [Streptomyces noursei PD-1]MCZ0976116.1 HPP family protein [Streptomyces noursei]UWS76668.1 HPP family protein [Streptomyces noursei]
MSVPPSPATPGPHPLHALRATAFALGALLLLVGVGVLLHEPLLIPPLAASAALVHGAPGLPISQPRNLIGGQLLSAAIGFGTLAVTGSTGWGAAVAASLSLGAMMLTHLSHSPAAATSVIVVLQAPHPVPFLPLLALATVLLVAIGLLPGRIGGHPVRYPVAW